MKILYPQAVHDIYSGVIEGDQVKKYEKTLGQVKGLYKNSDGMSDDSLVYTVYSYETGDANQAGNLYWGLTILEPIRINGECNMTRGHFHLDKGCAEFYFGIEGEGLLLLMDEKGNEWAEQVFKGSLHHIDGAWAHRLINTGAVQMKVGACWPTVAGHDYEAIEQNDFPTRIFYGDGKEIVRERR